MGIKAKNNFINPTFILPWRKSNVSISVNTVLRISDNNTKETEYSIKEESEQTTSANSPLHRMGHSLTATFQVICISHQLGQSVYVVHSSKGVGRLKSFVHYFRMGEVSLCLEKIPPVSANQPEE